MIHLLVKNLVMYDEYLYLSVDGWFEEEGNKQVTQSLSLLQIRIQWRKIYSNSTRAFQHTKIDNFDLQHGTNGDRVTFSIFIHFVWFLVTFVHVCNINCITMETGYSCFAEDTHIAFWLCIPIMGWILLASQLSVTD